MQLIRDNFTLWSLDVKSELIEKADEDELGIKIEM
jgi:hypothetical protein